MRVKSLIIAISVIFSFTAAAQDFSDLPGWSSNGQLLTYGRENLWEHINGAADQFLDLGFQQLQVMEFSQNTLSISIEIYDMGNSINAFGIYSAERFPENQFVDIGLQGYQEEGALNFFGGRYYVKLLCFDCEAQSGDILTNFAKEIVKRSGNISAFPALLSVFPKEGLLPYTEKFILRNFMGYSFLHDGFLASYKAGGQEFDCFIIDGKNAEETQEMVKRFLQDSRFLLAGFLITSSSIWYGNMSYSTEGQECMNLSPSVVESIQVYCWQGSNAKDYREGGGPYDRKVTVQGLILG